MRIMPLKAVRNTIFLPGTWVLGLGLLLLLKLSSVPQVASQPILVTIPALWASVSDLKFSAAVFLPGKSRLLSIQTPSPGEFLDLQLLTF
jgi:hypothetical protein